jgi:DNA-binding NarL/FixJ family response regulator
MVTSVLIVDDDEGFRRAAAELLEARGYRVVAEEATGEDALVRALELEPDAVLLDVKLPDRGGRAVATEIHARLAGTRVLLTSTDPEAVSVDQLDGCGAAGFVSKAELATADLDRYLRG